MSKGFDFKNGDTVVNKTIELVEGTEHLRQMLERVIGTNLNEWKYDTLEGIDFGVILCKHPDESEIRSTIDDAINHLDSTLTLTECTLITEGRNAIITFKVTTADGEEIGGAVNYAN